MSCDLGAEYVVANMLAHRKRTCNKNYVTFSEVGEIGWEVQKACNEADVDVIVCRGGRDVKELVYDFPEYFEYAQDHIGNAGSLIVSKCGAATLESRFVFFLKDAQEILLKIIKEQMK